MTQQASQTTAGESTSLTRRQFLGRAAMAGSLAAAPMLVSASMAVAGEAAQPMEQNELSRGWKIKSVPPRAALDAAILAEAERAPEADGWLAARTMPAMVHDILLAHGKIEPAWLPGRAEKCRWVAEQDWLYAAHFAAERPERESWLHFKGLDTIADVYLNGERIASHSNMYVPLAVKAGGRLRADNTLVLHGSRMAEVVADASLNEALTQGTVSVDVAGTSRASAVEVRVRLVGPDGGVAGETTSPAAVRDGAFTARAVLTVERPRLWWPRGYGEQPLYRAEVTLLIGDRPHQTERRTLGFRRVTMLERLHFVVNNVPVRLWGGDWVTPDWQTEVWDPTRVGQLFKMAENANFNVFRIWGCVASPRDDFYEMADARGFLLWQDFTDLPLAADEASRAVCRQEAADFVKRLKHHPSILCWCGGNEAAMWHHEDYNAEFKDRGPWPGLAAAEDVGAVCRQLDPSRYYQPNTPYYGMNPNDPREGNTHGYTNMWFVPGYDYLNFASEDTRIAAPVLHSLKRFMAPEDLWPEGYSTLYLHGNKYPYPRTWLRYTTGESWKKTGPVEQFYDAADTASLVYRLGMAEALYYQDTVERQRRGREAADPTDRRRCGGYIAWKFNDSWPQIYSAKVDYFLEPYHAYYALRRAYAPVLLSFEIGTYLYLWAVNDSMAPVEGTVKIRLLHLDRNEFRKEIVREVAVAPGKSVVIVRLDQGGIRAFRKEHVLFATLTDKAGRAIARADALADIERRVTFPNAKLDVKVENGALAITTDKFARSVTLEGDAGGDPFGWFFEDNYFDLMPGETKIVRVLGRHSRGRITAKAWYSSETTTVDWK
ncbi:MAG: beta-galactosidase [Planctomycetota bacterium]|nr:beta-galactosidase [Planctomycetota bacterium]